jgi:hypothetical protein
MGAGVRVGSACVAAIAAAALIAGSASAHDKSGHSESSAKSFGAPFYWHVTRDSDGHVHGYFQKGALPKPGDAVLSLQGHVTCADFEGNKVAFLYRVEDKSRPFLAKGQYVLITGEDHGGHGRDRVGFYGPYPKPFGCKHLPAPFPVTSGRVHVDADDD